METCLCPLGLTEQPFPVGSHICQIYSDDNERLDSLLKYLESGLSNGEKAACFSDNLDDSVLADHLAVHGLNHEHLCRSGALTRASTTDVYFQDGRFDPDRMLSMLRAFYESARADGYTAARVIGEMIPAVHNIPGGSRLMEYESRVSLFMRECPVTAVCQYNANIFDGATIMQVLKVHPLMVIRGAVVHNPYFIPPEEYLKQMTVH